MSVAAALDRYLIESPIAAFDWASANCCHFASRWVLIVEGRDPMAAMSLPATPSQFAARRLIVALGGSLEAAWTKCLGRPPIPPTLAQVGDVVLVPLPDEGAAVGICVGRDVLCVAPSGDRVAIGMQRALCAWRIGAASCA